MKATVHWGDGSSSKVEVQEMEHEFTDGPPPPIVLRRRFDWSKFGLWAGIAVAVAAMFAAVIGGAP